MGLEMKSNLPNAGQQPAAGDVVIERDPNFASTFRVRIVPDNVAPLAMSAHEVAFQLGRAVARLSEADLWHCDGVQCRLLLSFRKATVRRSDAPTLHRARAS